MLSQNTAEICFTNTIKIY